MTLTCSYINHHFPFLPCTERLCCSASYLDTLISSSGLPSVLLHSSFPGCLWPPHSSHSSSLAALRPTLRLPLTACRPLHTSTFLLLDLPHYLHLQLSCVHANMFGLILIHFPYFTLLLLICVVFIPFPSSPVRCNLLDRKWFESVKGLQ